MSQADGMDDAVEGALRTGLMVPLGSASRGTTLDAISALEAGKNTAANSTSTSHSSSTFYRAHYKETIGILICGERLSR